MKIAFPKLPPFVRSVTVLVAVGAVGIYLLGLRDEALAQRDRDHQAAVNAVLHQSHAFQASAAALKARQQAAERRAASLRADRDKLADSIRTLTGSLASAADSARHAALDGLLPALKLERTGPNAFTTDSGGVRFLAAMAAQARAAAVLIPVYRHALATDSTRIDELGTALASASARADAAEGRVATLEPLLKESERLRQCHILGLLPCPSRTLSYVLGAGTVLVLTVGR